MRWYVRYQVSCADRVEWLAKHGVSVDCSTIYRWVQRFVPPFEQAVGQHRTPVGAHLGVDLTYIGRNLRLAYC